MTDRDQIAAAIHAVLAHPNVEDFIMPDWPDETTANIMRALVKLGALPAECSPEHVES